MENIQRLISSNGWLNARLLEKDFEIQNLKAQIQHLDNIIEMGLAEFNEQSETLELSDYLLNEYADTAEMMLNHVGIEVNHPCYGCILKDFKKTVKEFIKLPKLEKRTEFNATGAELR